MNGHHTWIEISESCLRHNFDTLQDLSDERTIVAPVVKANAYGHGLRLCADIFVGSGAGTLCVNEVAEAEMLHDLDVNVLIMGPVFAEDAPRIAEGPWHITVSSPSVLNALDVAGKAMNKEIPIHIKVETGTNRQGLSPDQAMALATQAHTQQGTRLAGLSTHLSDVEDETTHTFAHVQLARFKEAIASRENVLRHCASSAAHLLFEQAHFDMVRPGIACYGLWPSPKTQIATHIVHAERVRLRPALTWKTRIAQVKAAQRGDYVGYGRAHRCAEDTRIAVLPVGYYDGYDRRLSSQGFVLVRGQKARILGRVCMNMTMVDVTGIADPTEGEEVVLLGRQEPSSVSAQELADCIGTIHYEITTRIHERIPRVRVD
jgi:alanine racemase